MGQRLPASPMPDKSADLGSLQQNPTLNGNRSDYNQEHQDEIVSSDDDELPTIEQIFKEATQRRMQNEGQQDNKTPSINQPMKRGREEDNQSMIKP
ncbi:hypothetical protein S40288_11749 [Stachybotrys chartarum IBT 40288]|nr:hypothetical protein S40288_11749 [Stachybotrys chartarum IBT 40288]